MKFRDYYEVMGLQRDATQDEVKRAYRKLARKYHPDVSTEPDAEAQFKAVGEAYAVLKDPDKRAAYDQLGSNYKDGQDFRPPPGWDEGFEFAGAGPQEGFSRGYSGAQFSDFFENLFAQGGRSGSGGWAGSGGFDMRGDDRHARIHVDFRDSYTGAQRPVTLRAPAVTADGHVVTETKTLNIKIPKGIRAGQKIRLAGQGDPGVGKGPPGDLFLEVEFNPARGYRIDGADVYLTLPVAPWEAALGATVKVPLPTGDVDLKVPPNSNQGSKLRLKGKGLPGKEPGDLYVQLEVRLPAATGDAARAAYQQLADALPFDPRAEL
ncbi:MAG: DnaJ C-terminal domain-containing protein [Gammaproteobacteria bacterium]|jgi:curved DNA-binding protein|nr:DnaJ C-terminal domain-containing protein [Gammaproteobacteria bacterium]